MFLPEGYQKPSANSKYLKFAEGDNKFRILSDSITGYLDWTEDKKPVRTKEQQRNINPLRNAKHFWAFVVWDYKDKEIKICEITQATIQNDIFNYHNDPNWGDPKGYDLNVKRTGKDMDTKYSVIPTPPMPLHPEIKKIYEATEIDLNALFSGDDPFNAQAPQNGLDGQIDGNNETLESNISGDTEIRIEDLPF